jgi:type I restriction enzyme S subunit
LGGCGEIKGGLQVTSKRQSLPLSRPYLRVANVHRGRLDLTEIKTIRTTQAEADRTRLQSGDLLFVEGHANPSEVGRVAIWDGSVPDCLHQNHLIRVRLDPSVLLPAFAAAWFNSPAGASHFRRAGKTTSGLNTISANTVRSAPTLLPPLDEQRRIAAILDQVDDLIRKVRLGRKSVDSAIEAVGREFFDKHPGAKRFPLDSVADKVVVGHVGPTSQYFTQTGVPFLRTGNIGDGEVIRDDLAAIIPEFHTRLRKSQLRAGDVLVSRVISDRVRCAILPPDLDGSNCANIIVVRPSEELLGEVITSYLSLPSTQRSLMGRRVGSAQSVVNTGVLKSLPIPVPELKFQRDLVQMLTKANRLRAQFLDFESALRVLFDSLQFRAFSGQL